jgi:hypothetical protein
MSSRRSRSRSDDNNDELDTNIDIVLPEETRRKPIRDKVFTRKNIRHVFNSIGKGSQPLTSTFGIVDNAYNLVYDKSLRKTPKNKVDPALARASQVDYPEAFPVIPDDHVVRQRPRNGGKKKRRNKTQKKRKLR